MLKALLRLRRMRLGLCDRLTCRRRRPESRERENRYRDRDDDEARDGGNDFCDGFALIDFIRCMNWSFHGHRAFRLGNRPAPLGDQCRYALELILKSYACSTVSAS